MAADLRPRLDAAATAQPAAAGRHPGAGLLAVRDALRAALLPPGRRRRGVPRAGRLAVGARDRRPAAARPDRRRHGPPAGRQPHLVGGLGRPHHARQDVRRTSASVLRRPARRRSWTSARHGSASAWSPAATRAACAASAGTARRTSPSRSPPTSRQAVALRILEQPEDYPAVLAEQQSVRAYPQPYGVNLAHVLGYLSPITEEEYDQAAGGRRPLRQRRLLGRPRRRREAVRPLAARHARLQARRRRLDGPRARRRQRGRGPAGRHPGHLDRRQGPGRGRARSSPRPIKTARADLRPGHRTATTRPTPAPSW